MEIPVVKQSDLKMRIEIRCRVDKSGRVLIPRLFREFLGVRAGDELLLRLRDGELRITTQQSRIEKARQRARKYVQSGVSLVDELRLERRREAGEN
jgi:AbrB family looped-hinge helix DNA binding protein